MGDQPGRVSSHVMVPLAWLDEVLATLWAYHNDEDGCDGNCEVMHLVRTWHALQGQVPAMASIGTYTVIP